MFDNSQFFVSGADFYSKTIDQSLRFDGSTSHLDRTMVSPTDNNRFTFSTWLKRSNLGTSQMILSAGTSGVSYIQFQTDDTLKIRGSGNLEYETDMKFRDIGSWYHIVFAYNSDESTAGNRARLYVNGTEITDFTPETDPASGEAIVINSAVKHSIGTYAFNDAFDFDGYLAEMYFVDGEQLAPTTFGETKNGIWIPIAPSISSFGNNGFHLSFADSSDIGNDTSGENHDFTPAGFAATDVVLDSPTNNFATMDALSLEASSGTTSEGNLKWSIGGADGLGKSNFVMTSGKWYCEAGSADEVSDYIGVVSGNASLANVNGSQTVLYSADGTKRVNGSASSYGASYSSTDIISIALDLDSATQTVEFFKNNASQGTINLTDVGTDGYAFACGSGSGNRHATFNFGQDSTGVSSAVADGNDIGTFEYAPPSGFLALCTSNLPNPSVGDPANDKQVTEYFDTVTYTGNGSTNNITGLSFQPGIVWIKCTSAASTDHKFFDSARGVQKSLETDEQTDEATSSTSLTAFNSDGFSLGADAEVNDSGKSYVAWCWKLNESWSNDASATGIGDHDSSGTRDQDIGMSIAKYVGKGTGSTSIRNEFAHGVKVGGTDTTPDLFWFKGTDMGTTYGAWMVQGDAFDDNGSGGGDILTLNNSNAKTNNAASANTLWTTTTVDLDYSRTANVNGNNAIAVCWSSIEQFAKLGTYEGINNADNSFIFTGFRPAWIMIKNIDATGSWGIWDTKRNTFNVSRSVMYADTDALQNTTTSTNDIDILSNGFKVRGSAGFTGDAVTYMYIAFAEQPLKYSNARQETSYVATQRQDD